MPSNSISDIFILVTNQINVPNILGSFLVIITTVSYNVSDRFNKDTSFFDQSAVSSHSVK